MHSRFTKLKILFEKSLPRSTTEQRFSTTYINVTREEKEVVCAIIRWTLLYADVAWDITASKTILPQQQEHSGSCERFSLSEETMMWVNVVLCVHTIKWGGEFEWTRKSDVLRGKGIKCSLTRRTWYCFRGRGSLHWITYRRCQCQSLRTLIRPTSRSYISWIELWTLTRISSSVVVKETEGIHSKQEYTLQYKYHSFLKEHKI